MAGRVSCSKTVNNTSLPACDLSSTYRKSAPSPGGQEDILKHMISAAADELEAAYLTRMADTPRYLIDHLHEVLVHVIPGLDPLS